MGSTREDLKMRSPKLVALAVAIVVSGVAAALWTTGGSSKNQTGTATTPCQPTATHLCAPSSIKDAPGEAQWTNTEAVYFKNENNNGNRNDINWWASNGAHTSSVFTFSVEPKTSKLLGFPCAIDHIFADNKGPANTVFTTVSEGPEYPVDPSTSKASLHWVDPSAPDPLLKGVRVLTIKNLDLVDDTNIDWYWQKSDLDPSLDEAKWFDYLGNFQGPYNIVIKPGKTIKIVLPCAANVGLMDPLNNSWKKPESDCSGGAFEPMRCDVNGGSVREELQVEMQVTQVL